MISLEFYHRLLTTYYSTFAVSLQLMTLGFVLASCITSFRQKPLWSAALGCLGDSLVASAVAQLEKSLIVAPGLEVLYMFLFFLPICYTAFRVAIASDCYNEEKPWWHKNNIYRSSTVIMQFLFYVPWIVTAIGIILAIFLGLWNISKNSIGTVIHGLSQMGSVEHLRINARPVNTTDMKMKATNITQTVALS